MCCRFTVTYVSFVQLQGAFASSDKGPSGVFAGSPVSKLLQRVT